MSPEDVAYIMNVLRQGTIKWSGRRRCLELARKKVLVGHAKNGNPIYKYHWQCAECRDWFRDVKAMEVDHVDAIGPFAIDWNNMVPRIYCGQENLACLCVSCHLKKTAAYSSARSRWKRK